MNARDRRNIADLLSGIASRDCNDQVNAGERLMRDHPKIREEMEDEHLAWWDDDYPEPTYDNQIV